VLYVSLRALAFGYSRGVLVRHRGHAPLVHPSAYVAPSAEVIGRVAVGSRARVMSAAVLDAEASRIDVGECAIVCEHAVVRATAVADEDHPVIVGDHAFVSPHATLLGCEIQAATYVATGATVLHGARVEPGAVVAVGALVHGGAVLPTGFFLAPGMIAIGNPVATYAPGDPSLAEAIKGVGFAARVRRRDCLGGPNRPLPRDRRGALGGVRRARRRRARRAVAAVVSSAGTQTTATGRKPRVVHCVHDQRGERRRA
jgi:carbonic anhydrase/acetyltransferase-like protein (isoleucine patch superfamily)